MKEIPVGTKNTTEGTVDETLTARAVKSGSLDVFSTPSLLALIEESCCAAIEGFLDEGETSVGMTANVRHISPTPVGMKVKCVSVVSGTDGKKVSFIADVYDESGKIGDAIHERIVVDGAKFISKCEGKLK